MPHKTFFWFIFPTGLAMILFIGLPIVSSFFQSLHIENQQILMEVENCDPFGCTTNVRVDVEATEKLKEENPLGRFNGIGTYICLLYTSPSPRDSVVSRMPSSA